MSLIMLFQFFVASMVLSSYTNGVTGTEVNDGVDGVVDVEVVSGAVHGDNVDGSKFKVQSSNIYLSKSHYNHIDLQWSLKRYHIIKHKCLTRHNTCKQHSKYQYIQPASSQKAITTLSSSHTLSRKIRKHI